MEESGGNPEGSGAAGGEGESTTSTTTTTTIAEDNDDSSKSPPIIREVNSKTAALSQFDDSSSFDGFEGFRGRRVSYSSQPKARYHHITQSTLSHSHAAR